MRFHRQAGVPLEVRSPWCGCPFWYLTAVDLMGTETPLLSQRGVLANVPPLLRDHGDSVALDGRWQDF